MTLPELQAWLLQEGVRDQLDVLTRTIVRTEIDNLAEEATEATDLDWSHLLLAGSILARSDTRVYQEAALRIATAAVSLSSDEVVRDAGAVLMDKLVNFRAVDLAQARGRIDDDLESRLGSSLRLEAQRRRLDHAVLVESTGHWLQVNDFQQRFWEDASTHQWLSASAPTASGKTFLVLQWLLDQLRATEARVAVYLAPTRALVSEIETALNVAVDGEADIEVSSLPLREKFDAATAGGKKLILVFTQERLHLLINALGEAAGMDLLIVDEAHKIGDDHRGIILQDAIERVARANPSLKVAFISPATQNPGELLADAPASADVASVDSDAPTVLQNLIVAEQVPRKPKQWNLALKLPGRALPIGTLKLTSSPAGLRKRLAFIAAAAGGDRSGTLVYANGAAEAEEVADFISQLIANPKFVDPELAELSDLVRKGVHPRYGLAPLVERGVAFHYGNMPSLIRTEVERLFRSGKIRFLVCTSTLIEGVNLSCRTIVVRGPRKGRGNPMEPHDFWNLAGRAGRWGDEFQGNIICINPKDLKAWPTGVPDRARYPIKRESDAVLDTGDAFANYLERRADAVLAELDDAERFEQVGGYLLNTYMRLGSLSDAALARRHDPATIARLEDSLKTLAASVEIDHAVAARHSGVSALSLQTLLNAFRDYPNDVENLLPAPVDSEDSYDRFVTIMGRINDHLFPAFMPRGLEPYHALIVVRWLKGHSLASMIKANIKYHQDHRRPFKLPVLIRDTMDKVEQTARFRAPKYLSAYMDILHVHLRAIGREDLVDTDLDIGTQLEFGVSSLTLLSLMELGLSRMSAVALYEKIARDDLTKDACVEWVEDRADRLDTLDIPAIILREVNAKLLGRQTASGVLPFA
ncbi:DEAD/DEAH box helicase [Brevundimonas nasdae]|uniref:DEAD/DEAH box helicase n=1 Tax=Brevundimonas nasdae TaxID=172043 RepID=UPI0030159BB8